MTGETILVVGGTGMLGAPVARALRSAGWRVRILARDPARARALLGDGYEYVRGDVEDEASLARAAEGCFGVHVSLRGGPTAESFRRVEHQGTVHVARAAKAAGVSRLTYTSGMYAGGRPASVPASAWNRLHADHAKARAEAAVRESGVAWTVFRPTYFMETLPRHLQGSRAVVLGRQPHRLHMVAADDYGRMVARAFATADAANRTFYVWGPQAVTLPGALAAYCAAVRPEASVVTVPLPVMRVVDRLFMGRRLSATLDLMRVMQSAGEAGSPDEANQVLGAPTTTLAEWCGARARER